MIVFECKHIQSYSMFKFNVAIESNTIHYPDAIPIVIAIVLDK